MARIAGIDLPRDKRLETALTYIYGIGPTSARKIAETAKLTENPRVRDLSDAGGLAAGAGQCRHRHRRRSHPTAGARAGRN